VRGAEQAGRARERGLEQEGLRPCRGDLTERLACLATGAHVPASGAWSFLDLDEHRERWQQQFARPFSDADRMVGSGTNVQ